MAKYSSKNTKFLADLSDGHIGELKFLEVLGKAVPAVQSDGRSNDIIFMVGDKNLTAEVKFDKKSCQTGNLAVEYENPKTGNPTGLLATKSHLWCFVFQTGEVWIVPTEIFKDFFTKTPGRDMRFVGDGNASVRLYKKEVILGPLFKRIDNIQPIELELLLYDYFG